MIRFDIENDAQCGGTIINHTQIGSASWTFTLPAAAEITLSMAGMAEADYETMTLRSDGAVVATVQAEGDGNCQVSTCIMCPVSLPSTRFSLAAGEHTLAVHATTIDGRYHNNCFFEISFDLGCTASPTASPTA